MVKSTIIFFDTSKNSRLGTLRGLVSFVPLVVIILLGSYTLPYKASLWTRIWATVLLAFFLCSAIGVQIPNDYQSAGIYGLLVGAVVGVSYVSISALSGPLQMHVLVGAIVIIISCFLLALLTRAMSLRFSWYPSESFQKNFLQWSKSKCLYRLVSY